MEKPISKVERLRKLLDVANEDVPSTKEIGRFFADLTSYLKTVKADLRAGADKDKDGLSLLVANALISIRDMEKRILDVYKKSDKTLRDEIREAGETFSREIRKMRDEIPEEIDLTPIFLAFGKLESAIPKEHTAEKIRDLLETLKGEERLSVDAISGLSELLEEISAKIPTGGTTANLQVSHWPIHEQFAMDGVATTVSLQQSPSANGTAIIVRYQGQTLDLTGHYTVDGNKITLVGFTPETGTIVSVTYWP